MNQYVWKAVGVIDTGDNTSTRNKTCPCTNLYVANPTWTDLRLKPCLCTTTPATDAPTHGTDTIVYCHLPKAL